MRGFVAKTRFQWALPVLAAMLPAFAIISSKGIVVLVALCALAVIIARPRVPGARDRGLILPCLLLAWSLLSLLWAYDLGAALSVLRLPLVFLIGLVLYLEVGAWDAERRADLLRHAFWGILVAMALMALAYLDVEGVLEAIVGRKDWINKIKPASTILVMLMWPVVVYVWRRWSFGWAVALTVLVYAVLWPGDAKAAKLALLAGAAVFVAAMMWRRAVSVIMAAAVSAIVLLAPVIAAQPMQHPERLENVMSTGLHRLIIWDFAAARIAERPLLGWGYNSSRVIPGGKAQTAMGEALPLHPHNAPLQIWLELGLPGAVLGAAIMVALVLAAGRWERKAAAGALAAFAAACVVGILSYGIWQDWWLCALIFIVLVCRALPEPNSAEGMPR